MRIGSLFSGVGGLDMAVQSVFGGSIAWHSEVDPAPSAVLRYHQPVVPNLGDVTQIDWAAVEPVEILTGGFPCQDVSCVGKRAGIGNGTRSGLWSHFAEAIEVLRPKFVVIENVKGLLSARANRGVESTAADVGGDPNQPLLRAIGAVCGDLGTLRYDTQYATIPASEIGAPHRRDRVFILATDSDNPPPPRDRGYELSAVEQMHARTLLPTPRTTDGQGAGLHGKGGLDLKTAITELPLRKLGEQQDWGKYTPAIRRWEAITRPAPTPNELNSNGRLRVTTKFGEWMMGWPQGHVTDPAIGLSRIRQIKAIGNGVVPQQAQAAISHLLAISELVPA